MMDAVMALDLEAANNFRAVDNRTEIDEARAEAVAKAEPITDYEVVNVATTGSFSEVTVEYTLDGDLNDTELEFALGGEDGQQWLLEGSLPGAPVQTLLDSSVLVNGINLDDSESGTLLPGIYEFSFVSENGWFEDVSQTSTVSFSSGGSDLALRLFDFADLKLTEAFDSAVQPVADEYFAEYVRAPEYDAASRNATRSGDTDNMF